MGLFKLLYQMADNAYKECQEENQKNRQIIAHPSKIAEFIGNCQSINKVPLIDVFENYDIR